MELRGDDAGSHGRNCDLLGRADSVHFFVGELDLPCVHVVDQFVTNTSAFVSFSLLQRKLLSEISLPAVSSTSTPDISSVTEDAPHNKENVPVPICTIKDKNNLLLHQVVDHP